MGSERHHRAANKEHHDFSGRHLSRYAFLYFHLCYLKRGEHKREGWRQTEAESHFDTLNMQITHKRLKDQHKEILLKREVQIDHFYLISLIHNYIFWLVGSFLTLPDSAGTSVTPQSLSVKTITNSPGDSVGPANENSGSEGGQKALLRVFPVLVHHHNYVQTEGPILSYLWCRLKGHGTNESGWTQEGKYIGATAWVWFRV